MSLNSFLYYEQIPGVIGIKTNIKGFRWGFGQCAFAVNESVFDKCKYKVIIEERRDDKVFDDIDKKSYDKEFRHFRVSKDKPGFLFEQTIAKAFKLRCCVEVCNKTIRAIVGRSYLKFVPIKLMNVHPISYIMFDLISILLLQDGLAPLYCSSVRFQDGKTIVFMAPPNTGKSLTVLQLKRDYNAEIVCEDMAITDGRFIWGAPYTALYRNYKDKSLKIERVSIYSRVPA